MFFMSFVLQHAKTKKWQEIMLLQKHTAVSEPLVGTKWAFF